MGPQQRAGGTSASNRRAPTHHVACVGDLSLDINPCFDIETRLICARESAG
jgi:hypothetical protein